VTNAYAYIRSTEENNSDVKITNAGKLRIFKPVHFKHYMRSGNLRTFSYLIFMLRLMSSLLSVIHKTI